MVLDAKGLRALAHPLRVRLVGLLRTHGPSTA
ncbi:regulatory protein ArsR, partial [Streptomyces mobaraensis NBRC 13819 = DSM 40847]